MTLAFSFAFSSSVSKGSGISISIPASFSESILNFLAESLLLRKLYFHCWWQKLIHSFI